MTRDLLDDGSLQRCIDELSVTGLTSNPTIFERAIKDRAGSVRPRGAAAAIGLEG